MDLANLTNEILGQYHLRELLGMGGMGAVYRAHQPSLKRAVAVKVLSEQYAREPGFIERFNREAEIAASLEHAHIVPIYDFGVQRSVTYVVMRLLTGGSLADRLEATRHDPKRPLPSIAETRLLLDRLAGALDYAHSRGVVHRDIKPPNIMFDHTGSPLLVDFGIAKLIGGGTSLTASGHAVIGTPLYMSPEQWRGEELTGATDQYALAVVVYMMLTGRGPFEANTPYELMHKHLYEPPTPVHVWQSELPSSIQIVLERALSKDPKQRFPSVTAFSQAFDSAVQGVPVKQTGFFNFPVARRAVRQGTSSIRATSQTQARTGVRWLVPLALALILTIAGAVLVTLNASEARFQATMTAIAAPAREMATSTPVAPSIVLMAPTATVTASSGETELPEDSPADSDPAVTEMLDAALPTVTDEPSVSEGAAFTVVEDTPANPDHSSIAQLASPTSSPTPSESPEPTATVIPADTATAIATVTPSVTASPTDTLTWTPTPTSTLTPTATVTDTRTPTLTSTLTSTPTATPTSTLTPSPTFTNTPTPTVTPTEPAVRIVHKRGSGGFSNPKWSPDGSMIAASTNQVLQLYTTGLQPIRELNGHVAIIGAIDWSPDSRYIATGGQDRQIVVWDVRSGAEHRRLTDHTYFITDIAWSPDGTMLATTGWDRNVLVYDTTNWTLIQILNHGAGVDTISWSPDSTRIATGTIDDSYIRVWDVELGETIEQLDPGGDPNTGRVTGLAWHPTDDVLITFDVTSHQVTAWDTRSYTPMAAIFDSEGCCLEWFRLYWSQDGQYLVGLRDVDRHFYLWHYANGSFSLEYEQADLDLFSPSIDPTNERIAFTSGDGLSLYRLQPLTPLQSTGSRALSNPALHANTGNPIFAAQEGETVEIVEVASGAVRQVIPLETGATVTSLAFSPDGSQVAGSLVFREDESAQSYIGIWNTATGEELRRIPVESRAWIQLIWPEMNSLMIYGAFSGMSGVYQLSPAEWRPFDCGITRKIVASPRTEIFACESQPTSSHDVQIWIYRQNGDLIHLFTDVTLPMALSPNGQLVAVQESYQENSDEDILIYDVESGTLLARFETRPRLGTSGSSGLWWSPNNRYLLAAVSNSAANEGTLVMLDSHHDYEPVQWFEGHVQAPYQLVWIDNQRFLTSSGDGTVIEWEFTFPEL